MLTICDLSRLNRATLEPEGIHTGGAVHEGGKGTKEERDSKCNGHNIPLGLPIPCLYIAPNCHSHSGFFRDCFFFEGFEMTLILLERNVPVSLPSPKKI